MSMKSQFELTIERAQKIYEERMRTGAPGNQESDWLQAEREIAAEMKKSGKGKKDTVAEKAPAKKVASSPAAKVAAPAVAKKKPGRKPKAATADASAKAPAKKRGSKKK